MIRDALVCAGLAKRLLSGLVLGMAMLLAVGCGSQTPQEQLNEAYQLIEQGQTTRGILKLREVINEHPDDPAALDARMLLARYYVSEGNAPKALENLEAVVAATRMEDPRHADALSGVIQIRMQIGEFEAANAAIEKELTALPESDQVSRDALRLEQSTVLFAMRNDDATSRATGILSTIMIESPEPTLRGAAREQLANYHREMGAFDLSNQVYQQYLAKYPEDTIRTEIEMAMAMNNFQAGNKEEALAQFEAATQQYLQNVDKELEPARKNQMLFGLAQMYTTIDQLDKAEEVLRRVMAENIKSQAAIDAQMQIAFMYTRHGLMQMDDELFNKGIELLEQMKRENPGTNIATTAENSITQAKTMMERLKNPPAPATDDSETTQTLQGTESQP